MSSVMDLHFSMQGEDILEHTHGKVSILYTTEAYELKYKVP